MFCPYILGNFFEYVTGFDSQYYSAKPLACCRVAHTHGNFRVDLVRSSRCFGQNEELDVIHAQAHRISALAS
jgi:hypothetical protein